MSSLATSSFLSFVTTLVYVRSGSSLLAVLFVLTDAAEEVVTGLRFGVLVAMEAKHRPSQHHVHPTVYCSDPRDTGSSDAVLSTGLYR